MRCARTVHDRWETVDRVVYIGVRAVSNVLQVADHFAEQMCLRFRERRADVGDSMGFSRHCGMFGVEMCHSKLMGDALDGVGLRKVNRTVCDLSYVTVEVASRRTNALNCVLQGQVVV